MQKNGITGCTTFPYSARNSTYELLVLHFLDIPADIAFTNYLGWNCLHIAALMAHLNLCKTLVVKYNFDAHMVNNDGWTALHHSVKSGSNELITYFIDMGADIHLEANGGKNCLIIAAMNGHLNLLEKHNFDAHMGDNNGWRVIH